MFKTWEYIHVRANIRTKTNENISTCTYLKGIEIIGEVGKPSYLPAFSMIRFTKAYRAFPNLKALNQFEFNGTLIHLVLNLYIADLSRTLGTVSSFHGGKFRKTYVFLFKKYFLSELKL